MARVRINPPPELPDWSAEQIDQMVGYVRHVADSMDGAARRMAVERRVGESTWADGTIEHYRSRAAGLRWLATLLLRRRNRRERPQKG